MNLFACPFVYLWMNWKTKIENRARESKSKKLKPKSICAKCKIKIQNLVQIANCKMKNEMVQWDQKLRNGK